MTKANAISFLDLVTPHADLRDELREIFEIALGTAGFIGGPMVQGFERDFAKYCNTSYCVGVANGTDALRFALIAAGLEQGDMAITVPNTFIATTEAISQAGARPAFVDIDERTHNMDPDKLRQFVETECHISSQNGNLVHKRTRRRVAAIVPVHLYGQTADMDPILDIAGQFNLTVVEDACQAHGAEYFSQKENRWRRAGSMGRAAAFSFYPGKNLGACGEAGAVTTNDEDLSQKIRLLRDHGQRRKYYHEIEGYNGRLDAIQAGILQVKLKHLSAWNEKRRQAADRYRELFQLNNDGSNPPYAPHWAKSVYHLYVIRSHRRDALIQHLADANIGTGIHYPVPLHLQGAYSSLGYQPGDFPVAERAAAEVLSLPMFPTLSQEQQERVVKAVMSFEAAPEAPSLDRELKHFVARA